MLPTHVALVPYNDPPERSWIDQGDLLHVAAALQTQATRDLAPVWGVSSVVSPFLNLTDVPPGYAVIVVLPKDDEFDGPLGFHFAPGGQPLGLVQYADDWSLFASHELLETLCDPWGNRTAPGQSLREKQGQVEYLVEICDPCQHSTYAINGVLVSDFVTPSYYDPVRSSSASYSFTGRVNGPRTLLEGGYLTWRTHQPHEAVWQAFAPDDSRSAMGGDYPAPVGTEGLEIGTLFPATFSRQWIDGHRSSTGRGGVKRPEVTGQLLPDGEPLTAAERAYNEAQSAAAQYGTALDTEIAGILASLASVQLNDDATRRVLKQLMTDTGRSEFVANAKAKLNDCGLTDPDPQVVATMDNLASRADYQQALDALNGDDRFGLDFTQLDVPGLTAWLCFLGGY